MTRRPAPEPTTSPVTEAYNNALLIALRDFFLISVAGSAALLYTIDWGANTGIPILLVITAATIVTGVRFKQNTPDTDSL
jgi:hypothetical protein